MFRKFATLLLLGASSLLAVTSQAETLNVHLILGGEAQPYQQFSVALAKVIKENKIDVNLIEVQAEGTQFSEKGRADLVIAVGTKAVESAIGTKVPLLSIMVPKNSFETLIERYPSRHPLTNISAIYLDQPWSRQLNFIQAILPKHSIVGVLYSPHTPIMLPRLPRGMSLNAKSVRSPENLFAALENILESSDVLLAIPDSEIYSSNNVRNILLTSYRHKVPLIGISQSYVNAGAIGAIFSTPEQLARQAWEMLAYFQKHRELPEPQYPESFSIAVNQQVARSLGIELDSPEVIRERVIRANGGEP